MVKKKAKSAMKKAVEKNPKKVSNEESEGGMSLDDAFGDDEDVEYAKPKPRKISKKKEAVSDDLEESLMKAEEEMDEISSSQGVDLSAREPIKMKASKPIAKIKKGDKIKVDALTLEVDAHYVLIDHGTTKEMTIELFDAKTDKDYQIRYFDDQVETTIEVYRLDEILYNRIDVKKLEW